ncbi:MAG: hypothetical protein AB4290_01540 [Spirulina sp.]
MVSPPAKGVWTAVDAIGLEKIMPETIAIANNGISAFRSLPSDRLNFPSINVLLLKI